MAELTLAGDTHVIAPFKLAQLRRAAPYIDRLGARAGQAPSVEAAVESASDMLSVLAAGIPDVTADALQASAGLGDLDAIRTAFEAVMAEAGLKPAAPLASSEETRSGEPGGAPASAP